MAIAVVLALVAIYVSRFLTVLSEGAIGEDLSVCQRAAEAWLRGTPLYPAFELAGPYRIDVFGLVLYPPVTMLIFAASLLLPAPLWWAIPAGIVGAVVYRLRPGTVWLLAIAACLAFTNTVNLIMIGNPDIWLAAALAAAVYWRPAAAFVLLKPSLFPLAFVGARSRGWWAIAGLFALVTLMLLPQTVDWLTVIRNGQGGNRPGGVLYSLQDLPLLAIPLLAWAGARRALLVAEPQLEQVVVTG